MGSAPLVRPAANVTARVLAAGSVGIAVVATLWSFRVPFPAWEIGLQAAAGRIAAAAAVGGALAAAGAIAVRPRHPLREARWFAISIGAAAGIALTAKTLGSAPASLLGGLAGGTIAAGAVWLVDGTRRVSNLGLGIVLGVLFLAATPAYMAALTEGPGVGAVALWILGDLSGFGVEAGLAALAGVVAVLLWASIGLRRDGFAPRSAEWILVGLAIGFAGLVAFVGAAGPAIARRCGLGRLGFVWASAAVGAALLVLTDGMGRILLGGYAPPANVMLGFAAVPALLWANRQRLRAHAEHRSGPVFEWLEALGILGLALGLGVALSQISQFVLAST